jgi:CDP-diacylglycerol--glycerol-3-phosphate 3-phosphatidyltransferase
MSDEVLKKGWKPNLADYFTMLRIVGTLAFLFLEPFTLAFYIVYTICGLSDIVDGWIARATKTTTQIGARLDSAADLLFYACMVGKILPALLQKLPMTFWWIMNVVLVIRFLSYLVAALKFKCFASLHTCIHKATGLLLFLLPYFLSTGIGVVYCFIGCIVVGIRSLEELLIHLIRKTYNSKVQAIWMVKQV